MSRASADLERLEQAMRLFFQTIKRPAHWERVMAAAGVGVDRPGAAILSTLTAGSGTSRLHDIAQQLGIEAPSVTRKTQALEQAGYVRRVPDSADKRAISLHITAKGRKSSEQLRAAQRTLIKQAVADWPANDRTLFINLFERFSHDLADSTSVHTKKF